MADPKQMKIKMIMALGLIVLTLFAYGSALQGDFIWDDEHMISAFHPRLGQDDGLKRAWTDPLAAPPYYPLVRTAFWLEHRIWGGRPLGYHLVNILLHGANALLVWVILGQLGFSAAFWAAAVFALHPVHVESVAWISELKNVLSGLFYLLSFSFYLRFAKPRGDEDAQPGRRRWYALAFLFFLAALLSKTITCSLPVVILLILWYRQGTLRKRDIFPLTPFFLSGLALGFFTVWLEKYHVRAQGPGWDFSLVERILIAGRAFWFYPAKLLWPAGLVFIYPRWEVNSGVWRQYVFPFLTIVVFIALWRGRKRWGKGPLAAVMFYAITIFPALGFFNIYPMKYSFVADHFQYLASLGWITLFAAAMQRVVGKPSRLIPVGAGLLLVLAQLTWLQGMNYRDNPTLYRHILSRNPRSSMARNNLGILDLRAGRLDEAIVQFRQVLDQDPDYIMAYLNLGIALTEKADYPAALEMFRLGLQKAPHPYEDLLYHNLGMLYRKMGQEAEAAEAFRSALAVNPGLEKSRRALRNEQEGR